MNSPQDDASRAAWAREKRLLSYEDTQDAKIEILQNEVRTLRLVLFGNGGKGVKEDIVAVRGKMETVEVKVRMINRLQWVVLAALIGNAVAMVVTATG